jgi:hypothetical protein
MYSLIGTAKLNGVDPQAWLADVLARIADHPAHQLADLLPWPWRPSRPLPAVDAPTGCKRNLTLAASMWSGADVCPAS